MGTNQPTTQGRPFPWPLVMVGVGVFLIVVVLGQEQWLIRLVRHLRQLRWCCPG